MVSTDRHLLERFNRHHEESAFEALLERHGPMVHGLCRRVLNDPHAAGDAFQATFLVLARRAASIRRPDSLGSWLYGVAYRIAGKLRMRRNRSRETPAAELPDVLQPGGDPLTTAIWSELRLVLDEELSQLPEKYRAPLVLCYLEGKSQAEAARELGWPSTSMASRLERGQEILRGRLTGRGVALSAALIFPVLADQTRAVPPESLVRLTAHSASILALGEEVAIRGISAPVAALVEGMMHAMLVTKLKIAAVVLLAIGMLGAGAGLLMQPAAVAQAPAIAGPPSPPPVPLRDLPKSPNRDRDGELLPLNAQARLGTVRLRQVGISLLVPIRDGQEVVTGDSDGRFRVWDLATGRLIRSFGSPRDNPLLGLFAPAGGSKAMMRAVNALSGSATGQVLLADGRTIAESTPGGAFRFWDAMTGKELRRVRPAGAAGFSGIAVAPDGKTVFTAGADLIVHQWDAANGKELRSFGKKREDAQFWGNPLSLSPDGKLLAVTFHRSGRQTQALEVQLWDTASGKKIATVKAPGDNMHQAFFTPDGKHLAWSGQFANSKLHLYDAATGKEFRAHGPLPGDIRKALVFSPDGKLLAVQSSDQAIYLWDMETNKERRRLTEPVDRRSRFSFATLNPSPSIAFTPDGKVLVVCDEGNTIRRWDVASGKELGEARGHKGSIVALAVSPDGQAVASFGADQMLRQWQSADGKPTRHLALPNWVIHAAFTADGKTVALSDGTRRVELWDVATAKPVHTLAVKAQQPNFFRSSYNDLVFSPDGTRLALRGANQTIFLWDATTGKEMGTFPDDRKGGPFLFFNGSGGPVSPRLAFSPEGDFLAAVVPVGGREEVTNNTVTSYSAGDSAIRLWHVPTGKPVRTFAKHSGVLLALALSPDGRTVAGIDADQVVLWETATGKKRCSFKTGGFAVSFSPDGRTIAAGSDDGTVHEWDLRTGQEIGQFKGHQGPLTALAFTAHGKTLISGSADTTALVWDRTRLARPKPVPAPALDAKAQESLWTDLAHTDSEIAAKAIRSLNAAPEAAVAIGKRLRPIEPVPSERLKQWLTDLQSSQFATREKATAELDKLGGLAEPGLRQVLAGQPSLEARQRVEKLLERLIISPLSTEQVRAVRVVEVLEQAATPEARQLLEALAKGAPGARQTRDAKAAVERLTEQRRR